MKTQFRALKFSVANTGTELTSERAGGLLQATQPEREELNLNPEWPASGVSAFLLGCSSAALRAYHCSFCTLRARWSALPLLLPPDNRVQATLNYLLLLPRNTVPTTELWLVPILAPSPRPLVHPKDHFFGSWFPQGTFLNSSATPLYQGIQSSLTVAFI